MCEERDKTKRALRRHHKDRMKAKALRVARHRFAINIAYYQNGAESSPRVDADPWYIWWAKKAADNLAECSCNSCRNPRYSKYNKSDRLSLQERAFFEEDMTID